MKVQDKHQDVERSGTSEESTFSMKTSARAFDILSTGLYTDNILAIVRELSCNAYDAHVDAGRGDVPFEVHLPNRLEPWFSVKDYGTGLSDSAVRTICTTYFDTTKNDSNDFIGALGLGSKSPFAYVSSYQIISRYNGYRRTYAAFINENGIPAITQMGEPLATDESNGLEVIVTVQEQDMRTFADKTATALMWFPVKPAIHGAPHFQFEQVPDGVLQGDNWALIPTSRPGFGHSSRPLQQPMVAVQGNVGYNVDISKLDLSDTIKRLIAHRGRSNMTFVGFFEIGELEVAASREEIRYDDRSVKALQRVVDEFTQDIIKKIEQEHSNLTTTKLWDGFVQIEKKTREMFGDLSLRAVITDSSQVSNPVLKKYVEMGGKFYVPQLYGHSAHIYRTNGYSDSKRMSRYSLDSAMRPDRNTVFFYNDVKHGGIGRIHQYGMHNTCGDMVVIAQRKNPQKLVDVQEWDSDLDDYQVKKQWRPMTDQEIDQEYHNLINALGNPDVKTVSQATNPVPRKNKNDNTLVAYVYQDYKSHRHRTPTYEWHRLSSVELQDMEVDKGDGIYMPLRAGSAPNRGSYEHDGKDGDLAIEPRQYRKHMMMLIELINEVKGTSYTFDQLLHVGKSSAKKLHKKGWSNVLDLAKEIIPVYADGIVFVQRYVNRSHRDDLGILKMFMRQWNGDAGPRFVHHVKQLPDTSPFKKAVEPVIEQFEQYYPKINQLDVLETFSSQLRMNPCDGYDLDNEAESLSKLKDQYPMLRFVTFELDSVDTERVFEYISTVDQTVESE